MRSLKGGSALTIGVGDVSKRLRAPCLLVSDIHAGKHAANHSGPRRSEARKFSQGAGQGYAVLRWSPKGAPDLTWLPASVEYTQNPHRLLKVEFDKLFASRIFRMVPACKRPCTIWTSHFAASCRSLAFLLYLPPIIGPSW